MGFCQWAEMGPRVGSWGAKVGEKWIKTHFSPTLDPFRDFRENPLLGQFKGGGNCFLERALRQSRPSISLGAKIGSPLSRGNFESQFPSPKLALKVPSKLPLPHKRGFFSRCQNCPRGEGSRAAIEWQKLFRDNFRLAAFRCLSGPSG